MILKSLLPWILPLALLLSTNAEDTVSSGNYLIHLCNSGQPNSMASKLQSLLPQLWVGLQTVIADVQRGTESSHGFSTFFKEDSSKAEVLRVYQQIAAGTSVTFTEYHERTRRPTFICAINLPETDVLYQICIGGGNTALLSWRKTELLPICPLFWEIKQKAMLSDCPLLVSNTLTPNDDRLLENQEALLVGVLVNLYHQTNRDIITTITDISQLNTSQSLLNAPTYALYYAAVQAGCVQFPNTEEAHGDGELRRLLEVPNGSDDANNTVSPYLDINSSVPVPPNMDILQYFCNAAVYAPNATVCCDESTGLWVPAPVIRDGPMASSMSAACPQSTGGTGGPGTGSGIINTRKRRFMNVQ